MGRTQAGLWRDFGRVAPLGVSIRSSPDTLAPLASLVITRPGLRRPANYVVAATTHTGLRRCHNDVVAATRIYPPGQGCPCDFGVHHPPWLIRVVFRGPFAPEAPGGRLAAARPPAPWRTGAHPAGLTCGHEGHGLRRYGRDIRDRQGGGDRAGRAGRHVGAGRPRPWPDRGGGSPDRRDRRGRCVAGA